MENLQQQRAAVAIMLGAEGVPTHQQEEVAPAIQSAEEEHGADNEEMVREDVYMAIHSAGGRVGFAWYDASTGEMSCMEAAEDFSSGFSHQTIHLARLHALPGTIYVSSKAPEALLDALRQPLHYSSAPANENNENNQHPTNNGTLVHLERNKLFTITSARPILESVHIRGLMPSHNLPSRERLHIINTVVNISLENQVIALAALLYILSREGLLQHDPDAPSACFPLTSLQETTLDGYLLVDPGSLESLAIFKEESHPSAMGIGRSKEGLSVFGLLNRCIIPSGKRLLRMWFARPLVDINVLEERMDAIQALMHHHKEYAPKIKSILKCIRDPLVLLLRLQRMQTLPVVHDIVLLQESFSALLRLKEILLQLSAVVSPQDSNTVFHRLATSISSNLVSSHQLIASVIDPEQFPDNFCIHYGISNELDETKTFYFGLPDLLKQVKRHEISRLPPILASHAQHAWDVVYVPQVGFLLQVQGAMLGADILEHVPDVQLAFEGGVWEDSSITGACYRTSTTIDLTDRYGDVLHKIKDVEGSILNQVVQQLSQETAMVCHAVHAVAQLDCFLSLSDASLELNLSRPKLVSESVVEIKEGRHLLAEMVLMSGGGSHTSNTMINASNNSRSNVHLTAPSYIPNDTTMKAEEDRVHVITGPNFSGKSCYIKQVAVIVFLAHIGCFVPAKEATIGLTDRIFTRIISKQSASLPQSTFMIDISQIATMLRLATHRSLLLIDEFGKGTLPSDGIGLLCGVLQHLASRPKPPKVLLVTHFMDVLKDEYLQRQRLKSLAFFTMDVVVVVNCNDDNRATPMGDSAASLAVHEEGQQNTMAGDEATGSMRREPKKREIEIEGRMLRHDIVFLYKLTPGRASPSFGVHCARMAGLDGAVLDRAQDIIACIAENAPVQRRHRLVESLERMTFRYEAAIKRFASMNLTMGNEESNDSGNDTHARSVLEKKVLRTFLQGIVRLQYEHQQPIHSGINAVDTMNVSNDKRNTKNDTCLDHMQSQEP